MPNAAAEKSQSKTTTFPQKKSPYEGQAISSPVKASGPAEIKAPKDNKALIAALDRMVELMSTYSEKKGEAEVVKGQFREAASEAIKTQPEIKAFAEAFAAIVVADRAHKDDSFAKVAERIGLDTAKWGSRYSKMYAIEEETPEEIDRIAKDGYDGKRKSLEKMYKAAYAKRIDGYDRRQLHALMAKTLKKIKTMLERDLGSLGVHHLPDFLRKAVPELERKQGNK